VWPSRPGRYDQALAPRVGRVARKRLRRGRSKPAKPARDHYEDEDEDNGRDAGVRRLPSAGQRRRQLHFLGCGCCAGGAPPDAPVARRRVGQPAAGDAARGAHLAAVKRDMSAALTDRGRDARLDRFSRTPDAILKVRRKRIGIVSSLLRAGLFLLPRWPSARSTRLSDPGFSAIRSASA
jgi:hypothetical protein